MKRFLISLITLVVTTVAMAQGWPAGYGGVMLQGFYWDSFSDSQWTNLEAQADDLAQAFSLVWLPQSANCGGGNSMGYDDLYWFENYNSSFGTEAQLRSLIGTLKSKGVGTIADVVINHRKNVSTWFDFPAETYNGTTYQLVSTDIPADDDDGAAAVEAAKTGTKLSTNKDTGEDWVGMRDLDHYSANVQKSVKAYLSMLLNDLGYAGFRYDMVKGYAGSFTGMYNDYAKPQFSVGEYWDGNVQAVFDWLNDTKVNGVIQSAAFDFPFRYTVRDAINNGAWNSLGNVSLAADAGYNQYAVTFVENHDTELRAGSPQDPIKADTLAANAFLLAMPGTPCVFYKHWLAYEQDIKSMIDVRKAAGITNTSTFTKTQPNSAAVYANTIQGSNGNLMVVVGNTSTYVPNVSQWKKVVSGYHYAYYLNANMNTAWVDKASGEYVNMVSVKPVAVTSTLGARLVYTTDGTEPTAESPAINSGTALTFTANTTLKVGMLIGGVVSGVVEREYTIKSVPPVAQGDKPTGTYYDSVDVTLSIVPMWPDAKIVYTTDGSMPTSGSTTVDNGTKITLTSSCTLTVGLLINGVVSDINSYKYTINAFVPHTITVYVDASQVGWTSMNFYTWNDNPAPIEWPGEQITQTKEIEGTMFYYQTYEINAPTDYVNFVFNAGKDSPQTVDVTSITQDAYFQINTSVDGLGHNFVTDITSDYTGIGNISTSNSDATTVSVYSIDGKIIRSSVAFDSALQGLPKGVYIVNGKKFVVK